MKYLSTKIFSFHTQLACLNLSLALVSLITEYFIPFSKDSWKKFHCDRVLSKLFLSLLEFYSIFFVLGLYLYIIFKCSQILLLFMLLLFYLLLHRLCLYFDNLNIGSDLSQMLCCFLFLLDNNKGKGFPHLSEAPSPSPSCRYLELLDCTNGKQSLFMWKYSMLWLFFNSILHHWHMRTCGSRNTMFAPNFLKMIWNEAYSSGTKDSRR